MTYLQQTTQPSPASDETVNWKTYKNSKLGYVINYPLDWGLDKCPQSFIDIANESATYICSGERFGDSFEPIVYYIYIAESNSGLDSAMHFTKEIINNLVVYRTSDISSRGGMETYLFKKSDTRYISLGFTPFSKKTPYPQQSRFYSVFNQILSTFKFLP